MVYELIVVSYDEFRIDAVKLIAPHNKHDVDI